MKPELAKAALAFLERVQLQGNEAPALMAVVHALEIEANPPPLSDAGIDATKPKHEPETTEHLRTPLPKIGPRPPRH